MTDMTDKYLEAAPLLTINDTARQLKVCRATVYGIIRRGNLAFVKLNGATRIRPADVADLIERNTKRSAA